MIEAQELTGYISQDKVLTGELSKTIEVLKPITQEKEVTPTKETQILEPDKDFTGLSKVTVNPIPNEYIVPSGEIEFTQNGTYDVTDKASAKVNIKEKVLGTKTITSNGTYKAIDDNLDGYSEVEVATSGVDIWDYFIQQGSGVFELRRYIQKIPNFNLSGVINMYNGFKDCANLKEIPEMDTSNIQDFGYSFNGCVSLVSISKLNFQRASNISSMTLYCSNLTTIGGFENLGQNYSTSQSENYYNYKLDLHFSTKLTEQSIINVLTNLYDIATKGVKPQTVTLGSTNLAKLVSEEGQQALQTATERGWNVS